MTETQTAPILAIGLGCRQGCSASTLLGLLEQSLQAHGIELKAIKGLASIDGKKTEPGLLELAQRLNLPLVFFSAAELAAYETRLSHRSRLAFEQTVIVSRRSLANPESAPSSILEKLAGKVLTV